MISKTPENIHKVSQTVPKRFPDHFQTPSIPRVGDNVPFDQLYHHFLDFQTGHTPGMNPSSPPVGGLVYSLMVPIIVHRG